MLNIRRRGKYYYVRGTVRVGKETVDVKEQSTGFDKLKDAREYVSKLEADIRESILNPHQDRTKRTTFDDCLRCYLAKKRLKAGELRKIQLLLPNFEGVAVSELKNAWIRFCEKKRGLSQSTLNRYCDTINAICNSVQDDLNITPPKIKKERDTKKLTFLMTENVRQKLLSCYSDHARPIFTVIAYQGFREQECLQLLWEDINLHEKTIVIRLSKNGETRQVPMHKKTFWAISREWIKQKKPSSGHVWLNIKGKPYQDTRIIGGGTPIRKAHTNALERLKKRFGIELHMRIHDFRHDWAGRMVMAGVDLLTVQKLGGWKSIRMVERYATFSKEHEIKAINKI